MNQRANSVTSTVECSIAAEPRSEFSAMYAEMLNRYAKVEEQIVKGAQ